jgi:ligand-binding SRPBCC domain-containing protein
MATIELVTRIAAPVERCFLLSLSIDLHVDSASRSSERAVAGVTRGIIGPGEEVTWEARHFGVTQRLTSRITAYEAPRYFQDSMVRGAFRRFEHDHHFEADDAGTRMIDRLSFASPAGPLGRLVDRWVLRGYLTGFLRERNDVIRRAAETDAWRRYLPSAAISSSEKP